MNAVGVSFEQLSQTRFDTLQQTMDVAIAAELAVIVPVLKALVGIYICLQSGQLMLGRMTFTTWFVSSFRALVVTLLIAHSGAFAQYVRTPLWQTWPQAISSVILSSAGGTSGPNVGLAKQMDGVAAAIDLISLKTQALSTGWSMTNLTASLGSMMADSGSQIILGMIAGIWLLSLVLMAIALTLFPWILLFELFERTRGWVTHYLATFAGLLLFGAGTSVLLAIQLTELQVQMQDLVNHFPDNPVEAMSGIIHAASNMVADLIAIIILPVICALGGSGATSQITNFAIATSRSGANVAGRSLQVKSP